MPNLATVGRKVWQYANASLASIQAGLVSDWHLDEASGNAIDSFGSNDLTDTAGCGSGTGIVYGTARNLASSLGQYFVISDNADISTGDIDFTFEAWVNFATTPASVAYLPILSKWNGSDLEYSLYTYYGAINFGVSSDGTSETGTVSISPGFSTGVWYHIVAWHDATNDQLGIAVNAGTPSITSYSGGVRDGAAPFRIGESSGIFNFDGKIGPVRFWKRVLPRSQRVGLYNDGAGRFVTNPHRTLTGLDAGDILNGLVADWHLDEASGAAVDSYGRNTLTDFGGVGSGAGIVYGTGRRISSTGPKYFTAPDNPDLSTGDIDFCFEMWATQVTAGTQALLSKFKPSPISNDDCEYRIWINGSGLYTLTIGSGTSSIEVSASNFGTVPTGTPCQIIAWHDSVNNLVGIAVNDGTPNTASYSAGGQDTSGAFYLGTQGGAFTADAVVGPFRFWKRVLTSTQRTALYNSGSGRKLTVGPNASRADRYAQAVWAYATRALNTPAFLSGFTKRKQINYNGVYPNSDLTDVPQWFKITADADIAAALAGGGGVAFAAWNAPGTAIPFGLYPSSNLASGDVFARVKLSPKSFDTQNVATTTGDVYGYIYYDATATTTENKSGTVSNGYTLFMPLEEDPSGTAPQMLDWVSNTKVGTAVGTMTSGNLVDAQVGKGLDFNASSVTVPGGTNVEPTVFTVSGVVKADTWGSYQGVLQRTDDGASYSQGYSIEFLGTEVKFWVEGYTSHQAGFGIGATDTGVWYKLHGSYDGSNLRAYRNGILNATAAYSGGVTYPSGYPFRIGGNADGIIDEVTVSSVVRSADWIAWEYATEFANATTFTLGAEEIGSGGTTYTATAALTTGGMTASGSATFASSSFTAVAALTTKGATGAVSATFTPPTYTGGASLTAKGATASGSATFGPGTKTATAALTTGPTTSAASATFASGAKTATAALTTGPTTVSGSATFAAGTKTATAALTTKGATGAVSATFTPPTFTATAALVDAPVTLAASATSAAAQYTGSSVLVSGPATASGSATFTAPTYGATAALTTRGAAAALSGTFTKPTYAGSAALTNKGAAAAAGATFAPHTYTAAAVLTDRGATLAASVTFTPPSFTAAGVLTAAPATLAASGTAAAAQYAGSASLISAPSTLAAGATFAPGTKTAAVTLAAGHASVVVSSTFTGPLYTAVAVVSVAPATAAASARYSDRAESAIGLVGAGLVGGGVLLSAHGGLVA